MSIKSKNDISYFKFLELSEKIQDESSEEKILEETINVFNPKNIGKFAKAMEISGKLKRRFKLDFNFNAGRFIDADTYRSDRDTLNMFKSILVPKKDWRRRPYKVEDISLREAEAVIELWDEFLADLKYRYEYIYNPPVRLGSGESTQGSVERQEFAEHYGGYAEMTYLISKGAVKEHKNIWLWDLDYFLFWGEYLLRKRDVENIK